MRSLKLLSWIFLTLIVILPNPLMGGETPIMEAKITRDTVIPKEVVLERSNPRVQAVMALQDRHTPGLMALSGVVGTATGITEDGRPAILVFTRTAPREGLIPKSLEGAPVVTTVTGAIFALQAPVKREKPPKPAPPEGKVDPASYFSRPVPIGVSTGNKGECSSGTIGARVKNAGNVYSLSNNHVYALENTAPIGSAVLQPGLYDTECVISYGDQRIGDLSDYEPIIFGTAVSNTVDAAIAISSTGDLGNSTPADGYGTPKSATVGGILGLAVQKYGRTTSLTRGSIAGINATVDVGYSSGTARFVDQIIVASRRPFIKPGDSGSLLVSDPGRNPVGLLFAGNGNGKYAVANRIDLVLNRFRVTIDGE